MRLLTIIIPLYNTEDYIEEALNSIVSQDVTELEVIVVDDGSNDNGPSIVREFCSRYDWIKLLRNTRSKGVSGARNTGIEAATGEYIGFLDSDDILVPKSLKSRIEKIKEKPDINVICWDYYKFSNNSDPIVREISEKNIVRNELINHSDSEKTYTINNPVSLFLEHTCIIWTGSVFIRKNHIENVGLFAEDMTHCEDTEYWFRCCLGERLFFYTRSINWL